MQKLARNSVTRPIALLAALVLASLALTGCTSSGIDVKKYAAVIDVRTADEFAMGHLAGAINIDVEAADFLSKAGTLDKTKAYILYCHSGRRAGIAVDELKANGFTGELVNAGGIDEAANSTGLSILTN